MWITSSMLVVTSVLRHFQTQQGWKGLMLMVRKIDTSSTGRERLIRSHSSARFCSNSVEIRTKLRPVIRILAKTSN